MSLPLVFCCLPLWLATQSQLQPDTLTFPIYGICVLPPVQQASWEALGVFIGEKWLRLMNQEVWRECPFFDSLQRILNPQCLSEVEPQKRTKSGLLLKIIYEIFKSPKCWLGSSEAHWQRAAFFHANVLMIDVSFSELWQMKNTYLLYRWRNRRVSPRSLSYQLLCRPPSSAPIQVQGLGFVLGLPRRKVAKPRYLVGSELSTPFPSLSCQFSAQTTRMQ